MNKQDLVRLVLGAVYRIIEDNVAYREAGIPPLSLPPGSHMVAELIHHIYEGTVTPEEVFQQLEEWMGHRSWEEFARSEGLFPDSGMGG